MEKATDDDAAAFERALRDLGESGRVGEAIVESLEALRGDLDAGGHHIGDPFSGFADSQRLRTTATLAPSFGLAAAVLAGDGSVIMHEPLFARLFGSKPALSLLPACKRGESRRFATLRSIDNQPVVVAIALAQRARGWPLGDAVRAALDSHGAHSVVLAYAPGLTPGFARRIAAAYGLTPTEARLAAAVVREPTLEQAASAIGVATATMRHHIRSLLRKTGATRRTGLLTRLSDAVAGEYIWSEDRLVVCRQAFALTKSEARVAVAMADGATMPELAKSFGISAHTVRAQLDTTREKMGVARTTDIARLLAELYTLSCVTAVDEARADAREHLARVTHFVITPQRRRIAIADYGPADGRPLLYFHGGFATRWMPPSLVDALRRRGLRPIGIDRPAFGLTDDTPDADCFAAAADDAQRVIETLGIERFSILARDGGVASALTLASLLGERIDTGVLLTPRPPAIVERDPRSFMATLRRLTIERPTALRVMFDLTRRQSRAVLALEFCRRVFAGSPRDLEALDDAAFRDEYFAMGLACAARTLDGVLGEQRAYRAGWSMPDGIGGRRWVVIGSGRDMLYPESERAKVWRALPGVSFRRLEDAGRLAMHTHADDIATAF